MGFCTLCGREVPDGEVCTCQQQTFDQNAYAPTEGTYTAPVEGAYTAPVEGAYTAPVEGAYTAPVEGAYTAPTETAYTQEATYAAPQYASAPAKDSNGIVGTVTGYVKETISEPFAAAKNFYQTATVKKSVIMVSLMAIVYVVTSFLSLIAERIHVASLAKKSCGALWIMMTSDMKKAEKKSWYAAAGVDGPAFAQAIFFPILYMALMGAVMVGVAYLINALFIKGKVQLTNLLKVAGAVSVPLTVILVLRFINNCIHVSALNYIIFHVAIVILCILVMLQVFSIMNDYIVDAKKFIVILAIAVACVLIGHYIVDGLMLGKWYPAFQAFPILM